MASEFFGAAKLKDGLFVGDEHAGKDLDFIQVNKITHIVNCAGKQVHNQFSEYNVQYLTYYWSDTNEQVD